MGRDQNLGMLITFANSVARQTFVKLAQTIPIWVDRQHIRSVIRHDEISGEMSFASLNTVSEFRMKIIETTSIKIKTLTDMKCKQWIVDFETLVHQIENSYITWLDSRYETSP